MEIGDGAGRVRREGRYQPGELRQEDERRCNADHAVDEVAERQAATGRIRTGRALEKRVDRSTEIGAEDEGERGIDRHDAAAGKRHHQEHHGHARMRGPGEQRGRRDIEDGRAGKGADEGFQRRRVLDRRHDVEEEMQRQQHQAEPDQHAAEIVDGRGPGFPEHQETGQDQPREDGGDIEGEHLHDEGRADIGAEHDRERRYEPDQAARREPGGHQPGRGAALQRRGHAEPGKERRKPVLERGCEDRAEAWPEGALHARLHHVRAPEEECNGARKIDEGNDGIHGPTGMARGDQFPANTESSALI